MIRLQALDITESFGPLQPGRMDFAQVHLIQAPNEAGKTSLIDALVQLLFQKSRRTYLLPGVDRFGTVRGSVQIAIDGVEYSLPKDDSILQLVGCREPGFGRLMVVRSGELELAAKRPDLMNALATTFTETGIPLAELADKVRDLASLTPRDEWVDQHGNRKSSTIAKYLAIVQSIEEEEGNIGKLAELEDKVAQLQQQIAAEGQRKAEFRLQLDQIREQGNARRFHDVQREYGEWRRVSEQIEHVYSRYVESDADQWNRLVNLRVQRETQLRDQEEHRERLESAMRQQRQEAEQLEGQIPAIQAARSQLQERHSEAKRRLDQFEQQASGVWNTVREDLQSYERIAASLSPQLVTVTMLLAGALALAGVVALAMLHQTVLGLILMLLGGSGLAYCALSLRRSASARQLAIPLKDRLMGLGIAWVSGSPQDAVRAWEIQQRQALTGPEREAWEALQNGLREEAGLRERIQSCQQQSAAAEQELGEVESRIKEAKTTLQRIDESVNQLRDRSGQPDLEGLQSKLREKDELGRKRQEHAHTLGLLTERTDEAGWQRWLDERRQSLGEDVLSKWMASLPMLNALEQQDRELRQLEEGAEEKIQRLGESLEGVRSEIADITARFASLGARSATDLYAIREKLSNEILEAARERIAGAWVAEQIRTLQADHRRALLEPMKAAGDIVGAITQRYRTLKYDSGNFVAVTYDGVSYPEDKLSTGTRAQLLFAVRFALLEQLLHPRSGFMILDEAFLTYDYPRRRRAIRWLFEKARLGWQFIYLTFDPGLLDLFQQERHEGVEYRCEYLGMGSPA